MYTDYVNTQILVGLFFSFLDFASFTLLSLSIYRMPILMYWKRLLAMQFAFLSVMYIHEHVLHNKDFYALSIMLVSTVLSTLLLQIPFLYSLLVWGTGYLLNAMLQLTMIVALTQLGIVTPEQLQHSRTLLNAAMLLTFTQNMLIVYYLNKKRLGFMFVVNRFRLEKRNIRAKDVFVALLFTSTVSIVQVAIVSFTANELHRYLIAVLGSMIIFSLIGLYITYKFNMQEIEERFNSFRRR